MVEPTHEIEFLGVGFNAIIRVMFVTDTRLHSLEEELSRWYIGQVSDIKS